MREPIKCMTCGGRFYENEAHICSNPRPDIGWSEERQAAREAFLVEENVRLKAEVERLQAALSEHGQYTAAVNQITTLLAKVERLRTERDEAVQQREHHRSLLLTAHEAWQEAEKLVAERDAEIQRLRAEVERAYTDGYDAAESHAAFGLLPGD